MYADINKLVNKIYVLTIERNSDRHHSVKSVLEGIDFEFWNGLDASEYFIGKKYVAGIEDDFFINNDLDKEHVKRLTIGQFGAYFSIKKMIDYIAKKSYDKVLIFEDDMLPLKKNWRNIFEQSLKQLPEDWDILLLGYIYDGPVYKYSYNRNIRPVIRAYNVIKYFLKKETYNPSLPTKFSKHLDIAGFSMGGHAFCLSKKGAKLLSSNLSPMKDSGDILISKLIVEKKVKAFSVYPCLFLQDIRFGSKTNVVNH